VTSHNLPALPSDWRIGVEENLPIGDPDEVTEDLRRAHVVLTVHRPERQPLLVDFDWDGEAYAVTGIRVVEGSALTSGDLTGLRLAALAVYAWHVSALVEVEVGSKRLQRLQLMTPDPYDIAFTPPPGGRGRPTSEDRLHQVALAWKQGKADHVNVKHAVADALHVSVPRAAVLIRHARERGLIPPTERKA
jgi:hypothetical protein